MYIAGEQGTYIQCTHCGEIYYTKETVPVDKVYVTSYCARCGHSRGLNCGQKEEEIAYFYDPVLDKRFYEY